MAFSIKIKKKAVTHDHADNPRYLLHDHLRGMKKARSYNTVHASDLMGRDEFCPREYALGIKTMTSRPDYKAYTYDEAVWAYGHAVEDIVIGWFADMGRAWGDWVCQNCNQLHSFQKRPTSCKKCDAPKEVMRYKEVRVQSEASGVSCGLDLLIETPGKARLTIIEIKSLEKDEFKKLAAPFAEHRFRTNMYMRCAAESAHEMKDRIDVQEAYVLYVTKGGWGWKDENLWRWKLLDGEYSPFKEYVIKRDNSLTDHHVELATMVKAFKETGKLPLGVCPTSIHKRAKNCPLSSKCFDEMYQQ